MRSDLDDKKLFGDSSSKKDASKEERKSLVQNFKSQVNEEIRFYDGSSMGSSRRPTQNAQRVNGFLSKYSKKQKLIALAVIIAIIVILVVVLAVTLTKSSNPDNPPPPSPVPESTNPYLLSQVESKDYGIQKYSFVRQDSLKNQQGIPVTKDNSYLDKVSMTAQLVSYDILRLKIKDDSQDQYELPQDLLESDFDLDYKKGVRFNEFGFKIGNSTDNKTFGISITDILNDHTYITSLGRSFLMMSHYQEFSFLIHSERIYGLGERIAKFLLNSGSYTIFPYANQKPMFDSGKTPGNELQGSHPFLMARLQSGKFIGIFLFNSSPQTFVIDKKGDGTSIIKIITTGGVMDLFFFKGPRYDDVVRQYQRLIGKPKMLPLWAHGIQIRNKLYADKETLYDHVKELIQYDINVEMVILPLEAMKNMVNFQFDIDAADFKKTFPDTKLAYPYTYFVPNIDETKDIVKEMVFKNMAVSVNNLALQVKLSDLQGYCIDFFHPEILSLLTLIQSTFDFNHTALFLDNNTPFFPSTSAQPPTTNPFAEIPYVPGLEERGPLDQATLPPYSQHFVDTNPTKPKQEYHFNLHSLYGTKMAEVLARNMPKDSKAFVISDSTFPGAGKYGIGHLLPRENLTYQSLKYDISNMLTFNMFGIPYSSPNLCGYEVSDDMELCIRSMQLSCVNPLAIINQDRIPVYPQYLNYSGSLQSVFGQRLRYMIYQRTELYKVQKYGGTLLKPLISLFPNDTRFDEDTFAYGESFKVEFITEQGVKEITRYFPEGKWYHIDERTLLYNTTAGIDYGFHATIKARLAEIEMFQKFGTIVAYQDARATKTENLSQLVNYPLFISILVDSFDKHSAIGNILIENGDQNEYYEVNMEYGIISFKQQNDGQIPFDLHKTIKKISVIDVHEDIHFACALMNDFKNVKELNAQTLQSSNFRTVSITPKTLDTHDLDKLQIDQLAFIFYSANDTAQCSEDTFKMEVLGEPKIFSDTTFYAQLRQNMYYVMDFDNKFYDIYLNITLLTDNSLYMFWSASQYHPYTSTPKDIYDRNFTQFKNVEKQLKLQDILTVNNNPFYIEIHEPGKPENVLFTTKDQIHFFYQQFNIFNYQQPNANPDRFFGIQERKGKFFLQDNYMYSLFNNDNNLEDRHLGNGRVIQHGRSGSHPVVMSQGLTSDKLTSVINFIPYGVDIIFRKQINDTKATPQITQISALSLLEFIFTFDLTPLDTSQAIHSHIHFGNFLRLEKPYFAPYYTMNGWYANSDGLVDDQGLLEQKKEYERNFYPIEGFNFNLHFLDNFDSLTLNKEKIKNENDFLQQTVQKGQSLISVIKSGFNEREFKEEIPVIQRGDVPYPDDKQDPVTGLDQSGKVFYLDYSAQQQAQAIVQQKLENYLKGFHESHKIVNLKYNQIFEVFSSEDVNERVRVKQENRLIYRLGTSDQMMNTIAHSALRQMGDDSKLHNLNPLLQVAAIKNISERYNILSDATCLGAGQLGVGRLLHYYSSSFNDLHLAIEQLQSLSVVGMSNVGLSLTTDTSLDPSLIEFQTKLLSMIPLTTERLIKLDQQLPNALQDQKRLRNIKYYLLPYMQTHMFISQNAGIPLIRPLFYQYPQNQDTYSQIDKQYMYGPNLKVSIQKEINEQEANTYFFKGLWCQLANTDYESECFYQDEDGFAEAANVQDFIYMAGGSILPISGSSLNSTYKYLTNVKDMTRKVDFHIVPDYKGTGQAYGEYVGQSETIIMGKKGLCVLGFNYTGDEITIEIQTTKYVTGLSYCTEEYNRGGDIVIYSMEELKYTKAEYYNVLGKVLSTYDIEKLKLAPAYRIVNKDEHAYSTVTHIKLI